MLTGTLFKMDGRPVTPPFRGLDIPGVRMVEGLRNNLGQVISQPVGRNMEKFNNLEWRGITLAEWELILSYVKNFYTNVTYYSVFSGGIVTRKFYWGDTSHKVLFWQSAGQGLLKPRIFETCKVNIIDTGE